MVLKSDGMNMCEGPILKNVILYTLPIIATGILQLLFNAADLIIVGRFCGSITIAAVGATSSLISLLTNLFLGLSVGVGVAVAHGLGAGDKDSVQRAVHTSVPIAVICGIVLTFIGYFGAHRFLTMMATPENVMELSLTYLKIYFLGITSTIVYNFGAAVLRAAGDTRSPLIYLTIAGGANVVLNIFFVTVFSMNVAGVALATAISQTIAAVLIVIAMMRRTDACRYELKKTRIHKMPLLYIIKIGLPAGIQSSLFSISNVIIQSSVNSFGDVAMSGCAAAGNIEHFVGIAINAYSQTALNFTAQNVGAGNYGRVRRVLRTCFACITVTGLTLGCAVALFARPLLGIYITDSAQAIEYGVIKLMFICLPYFLAGLMDATTSAIRGMGASLTPMIITIGGVCGFRILWVYTIFQVPRFHTLNSLFSSYAISWALTFLVQLAVYLMLYKKRVREQQRHLPTEHDAELATV